MLLKKTILYYAFSILLTFGLWACGGGENTDYNEENNDFVSVVEDEEETANSTNTESNAGNLITVNDESGKAEMSFDLNGAETIIKYDNLGKTITGRKTKADKAKYYDSDGNLIAEVKYKDYGFKLRDSDANLYWKVKFSDEKIKISDNEEGENPYEIKKNDTGKFKIKLGEEQLVEGKLKDGKITITGKGVYVVPAKENHAAYTVLALGAMEESHRAIVAAEILKK